MNHAARIPLALSLAALAAPAAAHPFDSAGTGFAAGIAHPFPSARSGADGVARVR